MPDLRLVLVVSALMAGACREPNPDWDPERQAETRPSDEVGEEDDTSSLPICEDHETLCGEECADLLTNADHCGACFEGCRPPTRTCEEGECVR